MAKVPRRKIASILAKRSLVSGVNSTKLSQQVGAYLLQTGRTGELSSLLRDVMEYRAENGIVEATAVSAHELDPKSRQDITSSIRELYPDAKQIILNEVHDPNIIGGVRLELANRQLDLSIRGKLNRFKQLTAAGE